MSRSLRLLLSLCLFLSTAACSDRQPLLEILDEGEGDPNLVSLWPIGGGDRLQGGPRIGHTASMVAVEPSADVDGKERLRLVSESDVEYFELRDGEVLYWGSAFEGERDDPVLMVPSEVRLGMKWRTGGSDARELEVIGNDTVVTPWGERREWAILSTDVQKGSETEGRQERRVYIEGIGLRRVDYPTGGNWRDFGASVRMPQQPFSSLPELPATEVEPFASSLGEELEFDGFGRFVSTWMLDDGSVLVRVYSSFVTAGGSGGPGFGAEQREFVLASPDADATTSNISPESPRAHAGLTLPGEYGTPGWEIEYGATAPQISGSSTKKPGAWYATRTEAGARITHGFKQHAIGPWDVGYAATDSADVVDPRGAGHRWRPLRWLTQTDEPFFAAIGDAEQFDDDAVDIVFGSRDGIWAWGSNDEDFDALGELAFAKVGAAHIRVGDGAREGLFTDADGRLFRVGASGDRARLEYLGQIRLPARHRLVGAALLGDIRAPRAGDPILAVSVSGDQWAGAVVGETRDDAITKIWHGRLGADPVDVTDLYPPFTYVQVEREMDAWSCWPTRYEGEGLTASLYFEPAEVTVEELGFAQCALLRRSEFDTGTQQHVAQLEHPAFGTVHVHTDKTTALRFTGFINYGGGEPSNLHPMLHHGRDGIYSGAVVHSALGIPLHDITGPYQIQRESAETISHYLGVDPVSGLRWLHYGGHYFRIPGVTGGNTLALVSRETSVIPGMDNWWRVERAPAGGGGGFLVETWDDPLANISHWNLFKGDGEIISFPDRPESDHEWFAWSDGRRCGIDASGVLCIDPGGAESTGSLTLDGQPVVVYGQDGTAIADAAILNLGADGLVAMDRESFELRRLSQGSATYLTTDTLGHLWFSLGTDLLEVDEEGAWIHTRPQVEGIMQSFVPLRDRIVWYREFFPGSGARFEQPFLLPRGRGTPALP